MEQVYTATFCAAFFSVLFVLAILVRVQSPGSLIKPNSALPSALQFITNDTKLENGVPWTTRNGSKVSRDLKCISEICVGSVYTIQLPKLQNPERPSSQWDTVSNAWTLTPEVMKTGYPLQYPFATVVKAPKDTPDHVKFVLPELRPATQEELNITGPYANAFAFFNTSSNELYFYRDESSYWIFEPQSATLVWPNFSSIDSSKSEFWNAYTLGQTVTEAQAAYFAEVLMFSRV